MPSPNQIRKEQDIKKEFKRMAAIKEHGRQKFSTAYIVADIAYRFYLTEGTVERIVNGNYEYERKRQKAKRQQKKALTHP